MSLPVRETISYPRVNIPSDLDPCRDGYSSFEHVLSCRHLIITPKPDEPCAPNCHHVATAKGTRKVQKMSLKTALKKDFYCDACVEVANERQIAATLSNREAEPKRAVLRRGEAAKRDKTNHFRKCYIAQKTTAVECDSDGDLDRRYAPIYVGRHPYDNALPRTGANMFEDVEVTPAKRNKSKTEEPSGKAAPLTTNLIISDELSDDEELADVDEEIADADEELADADEESTDVDEELADILVHTYS